GSKMATLWLGLHAKLGIVDRRLTKRPTMTFGYGSKQYGMGQQLADYLRGHDQWLTIKEHFSRSDFPDSKTRACIGEASGYISELIWAALASTVDKAFSGMLWMQRAAQGITRQNHLVRWTVP